MNEQPQMGQPNAAAPQGNPAQPGAQPAASREEQIGFHKGALSTLAKEREEMQKILGIVEQLMQMHIKGLKDLGIDLVAQAQQQQGAAPAAGQPNPQVPPNQNSQPLDDMLNR